MNNWDFKKMAMKYRLYFAIDNCKYFCSANVHYSKKSELKFPAFSEYYTHY